jgi:hypothetical protein
MINMYSQIGQDEWVLSLFDKYHKGFFLDVGCFKPQEISNTLLLEENGWDGLAFDIEDYSELWIACRKTLFIQADTTKVDFTTYKIPHIVDYLSLDVDFPGMNYQVMKRLIDFGFKFKTITIEHNLYGGKNFDEQERRPQRALLFQNGYTLLRADASDGVNKFEDWWINKKYINV